MQQLQNKFRMQNILNTKIYSYDVKLTVLSSKYMVFDKKSIPMVA